MSTWTSSVILFEHEKQVGWPAANYALGVGFHPYGERHAVHAACHRRAAIVAKIGVVLTAPSALSLTVRRVINVALATVTDGDRCLDCLTCADSEHTELHIQFVGADKLLADPRRVAMVD